MYTQHELSAKFPRMPVEQFEALVDDIKRNGLRHPIILCDGEILDGWHRHRACVVAKVQPVYQEYDGGNPIALVLSENFHRRDLTPSQRALIAVQVNQWRASGVRGPAADDEKGPSVDGPSGRSSKELASDTNTSTATIERAKVVEEKGSEALKESVRSGEATVRRAAEIAATVPKGQQAQALRAPKPEPEPKAQKTKQAKPAKPATVLKADHDKLVEQYNELRENRDDLAAELEALESMRANEHVVKIKQLQFQLRVCGQARDDAMNKAQELFKLCGFWKKWAEKLGWKPKDAKP